MTSRWDAGLPSLALESVHVDAASLTGAWKTVSTEHLARSVLVTTGRAVEDAPFAFECTACTVDDVWQALATTYELVRVKDGSTAVEWWLPAGIAYEDVLNSAIGTPRAQPGLPMQSGILEPVGNTTGITVKTWGSAFQNTFDYAVDVDAGTYTARALLSACCAANPTKTFHARIEDGQTFVTAVNLVSDAARVPAGAVLWWEIEIGADRSRPRSGGDELVAALADSDPHIRQAARNFLEATIWTTEADDLASRGTSIEQRVWTSVGLTSVLVRSRAATHRASIDVLRQLITRGFLESADLGLATICALEFLRLAGNRDALDVVTSRPLDADALAMAAPDACRIAALSPDVRDALGTGRGAALAAAMAPLAAMLRSPAPGRIEMETVRPR